MKRIAGFTALLLLGTMGIDGSPASSCGQGTDVALDSEVDAPDGGTDDGGVMADGGGTPDGGGMMGAAGKALHLIDTGTGEDYGLLVDYFSMTVFNTKHNILILLGSSPPNSFVEIYFTEPFCNGKQYIMPPVLPRPGVTNMTATFGPLGTYLKATGSIVRGVVGKSTLRQAPMEPPGKVECSSSGRTGDMFEFIDTGVKKRPPDDQLKVELR